MTARHATKGRSNAKADARKDHARHAGHLAQDAPGEKNGRHPRSAHRGRTVAVAVAVAAVVAAGAVMASPQLRGQIFSPAGHAGSDVGASDASSRRDDSSSSGKKAGATKDGCSGASTSDASTSDASTSAKAKAAPQEDTTALDTGAGAKVTTFATSGGISVTAPAGFESTPTCRHLQDAVAAFTARGYHLGFAMVDLKTGRGASYNASQKF